MKVFRRIWEIAVKPFELLATLLHFLGMRTMDILFGNPALKVRRAAQKLALGRPAPARAQRVKLRRLKCIDNPLDCAACMRSCPEGVFFIYPKNREYGRVCDSYELVAAFKSRCNGCGVCVEVCPRSALRLG